MSRRLRVAGGLLTYSGSVSMGQRHLNQRRVLNNLSGATPVLKAAKLVPAPSPISPAAISPRQLLRHQRLHCHRPEHLRCRRHQHRQLDLPDRHNAAPRGHPKMSGQFGQSGRPAHLQRHGQQRGQHPAHHVVVLNNLSGATPVFTPPLCRLAPSPISPAAIWRRPIAPPRAPRPPPPRASAVSPSPIRPLRPVPSPRRRPRSHQNCPSIRPVRAACSLTPARSATRATSLSPTWWS